VTILTKGAHTPDCFPGVVRPQLLQSLDRLGTDAVDIYLLHRDNLEVPVGEFVDALHQVWEEGLTRLVGVSNWSRERLQAARAYAVSHGRCVPSVVSNQFSLAEMNAPLWAGSHSASDADWRDWLQNEGDLTLVGWSSLARGYLVAGETNGSDDPERQRVWESEINRTRRSRVEELAARRGVPAAAVAVAYVLSQPFPSIALIGPRTLSEQLETLRALEVELLPEDVAYLRADDHADVREAVTP
jgi:aryl-alcohol dehydrogenase-like predicted oxidoreductase